MELLLWLYFYDNRWFFNVKVPVKIYKYIWILPILLHSLLVSIGVYYLEISDDFRCDESLRIWLYHRIVFSFLICLNMIFFILKISQAYDKENNYFEKARKALPILNNSIHEYDYWIRRNSLFSTPGVLLLFQGFISFFWSYMISALYKEHYYHTCGKNLQQILNYHSKSIWYGNLILIIVCTLMCCIKVFFFLISVTHPEILVKLSLLLHKKSKTKIYFHQLDTKEVSSDQKIDFSI